jgi:hypothetical protein
MNVLFLVGNGFDISAGLKARYEDVLKTFTSALDYHAPDMFNSGQVA